MKKILFTGGGGAGFEAVYRLLGAKHRLYFADADVSSINPIIPRGNCIQLPMADESNFVEEVVRASNRLGVDFVVPCVDEELFKIKSAEEHIQGDVFLPSMEFLKRMLDKLECANKIIDAGLTGLDTRRLEEADQVDYPAIIKPRSGRGSRGVMVVSSVEEVDAYKTLYCKSGEGAILQELAMGQEYTVLVSANRYGELNGIVPVKVLKKKGVTISALVAMTPDIIDYVRSFQERMGNPSSVYNLQCVITEKGKVLPFEINPRVSTTFCMGVATGFDPFDFFDQKNEKQDIFPIKKNVSIHRYWHNYISTKEKS